MAIVRFIHLIADPKVDQKTLAGFGDETIINAGQSADLHTSTATMLIFFRAKS